MGIEVVCIDIDKNTHNGILFILKIEILSFVTILMDLEGIVLNEISQRQIPIISLIYAI